MRQITGNLACFMKIENAKLANIMGTSVDDTISTYEKSFDEKSRLAEQFLVLNFEIMFVLYLQVS